MDRGHADVEGIGNFGVGPRVSIDISLQEDSGSQGTVRCNPFPRKQTLQSLAFILGQSNDVFGFLAHGSLLLKGL